MGVTRLFHSLAVRLWRLVTTSYEPDPQVDSFLGRAVSGEDPRARATVAVPTAAESRRLFGVDLGRRGIQPVFLRIENLAATALRLQAVTSLSGAKSSSGKKSQPSAPKAESRRPIEKWLTPAASSGVK